MSHLREEKNMPAYENKLTHEGLKKHIERDKELKNNIELATPIICKNIGISKLDKYQVIEYIVINFLKENKLK